MTDILLENGCPVRDSKGNYVRLGDPDARFQRALVAMNVRRGRFIYHRSLGFRSNDVDQKDMEQSVTLLLNEALAPYENTAVLVTELGDAVKVEVTVDDETREGEVRYYGQL